MDEASGTEICKLNVTTLRAVFLSSSIEWRLVIESQVDVSLHSALFWNVLGHMLAQ